MLETIQEAEDSIEAALFRIRSVGIPDPAIAQALEFLAPRGFRPVVELREDDRKKRRTDSADNWQPATGEIRIYFEPSKEEPAPSEAKPASPASDSKTEEMLQALEEAETTAGRTFVSLKWFRDEFLPAKGFSWAQTSDDRQAMLAKAIADGAILTSKVANPRAPLYPTTTIKVNRQRQPGTATQPASRFRPVRVSGEPLSATLLRDRGSR